MSKPYKSDFDIPEEEWMDIPNMLPIPLYNHKQKPEVGDNVWVVDRNNEKAHFIPIQNIKNNVMFAMINNRKYKFRVGQFIQTGDKLWRAELNYPFTF